MCDGKKGFSYFNDITKKQHIQPCVCEDGTKVGELKFNLLCEKRNVERFTKELKELREWVEGTSTCTTCQGKQGKTLGLHTCEECGLPGNCPWPG